MNSDIELEIGTGSGTGNYVVRVIRAAAGGEPTGTLELDVEELLGRRSLLEATLLASAVPHRGVSEAEQPVREAGRQLFQALFTGPVNGMYRASLMVAQQQGRRLRVVLRLTAPELAALPWEMLFDPETETYLCRQEPLVRHVHAPYTADPLQVRPPLRVLGLVASPQDLPTLDVDAEKAHLAEALAGPVVEGLIELTWVPEASWQGIHTRLLAGEWHVLHFVGHGGYNTDTDEGVLALVGANGRKDLVEAGRLADLLGEAQPTPRLVVLNSCSSGQTGANDLFSGTAAALARSGISAVAAMQFTISDTAAIEFARGFYAAIAHGRGMDEAARSGRIAILGTPRSLEWVTPVLYLRGDATHLFTFTETTASPARFTRPQPPPPEKTHINPPFEQEPGSTRARGAPPGLKAADDPAYTDGLSAWFAGRFNEAVEHFTALQTRFPGDPLVQERLRKALLRRDCDLWYSQGVAAAEQGDWDQAIAAFEQVPATAISETDAYADTTERLRQARWQQRRSAFIDDVRRLHAARQWEAAIAAGQELEKFDPATPDPDGLITQAREALVEQTLAARYATGLKQFDNQDWQAAIDTFTGIEHDRPGYRDTPALLRQLQALQRKHETSRRVSELQHQLRASAETGDWAAVATASVQLTELDPGGADPGGLVTQARQALLTQVRDLLKTRQHQRTAELEHRYAWARAAEDSEQWFEAAQHFEDIFKIDPAYRDAAARHDLCRQRDQAIRLQSELEEQAAAEDWPQVLATIKKLTELDPSAAEEPAYAELAARARRELATHPSQPQWRIDCGELVNSVAWHPDGNHLAVATHSAWAHIYDFSGKEPKRQLTVEAAKEQMLDMGLFTTQSTGRGSNRRTWRSRISSGGAGRPAEKLEKYINVFDVSFSPDGTRLATAGTATPARIWDAASGQQLLKIGDRLGNAVVFSPDGTKLAVNSLATEIWDAASGQQFLKVDDRRVNAVAFSPDGTRLATGSGEYSARIWDAASGQQLLKVRHDSSVEAVAFSPDGTRLATGSGDCSARIWDAASGQQLLEVRHDRSVEAVAFSPDGTRLATGSHGGARIWDATSGEKLFEICHRSYVRAVAFSPDGTRLATGSWDKSVQIWPVAGL